MLHQSQAVSSRTKEDVEEHLQRPLSLQPSSVQAHRARTAVRLAGCGLAALSQLSLARATHAMPCNCDFPVSMNEVVITHSPALMLSVLPAAVLHSGGAHFSPTPYDCSVGPYALQHADIKHLLPQCQAPPHGSLPGTISTPTNVQWARWPRPGCMHATV